MFKPNETKIKTDIYFNDTAIIVEILIIARPLFGSVQ
jgi:hypothetical protein